MSAASVPPDSSAVAEPVQRLSREELSELVAIMLEVGEAMIESGAAALRTEQTMAQIGLGLGADRVELYITPTGIVATAVSGHEQRTRVGRAGAPGVDMAKIAQLNDLSRHIALLGGTLPAARRQLAAIHGAPRQQPAWVTIPAVGLACASFAHILGGDWTEFVAAGLGGAVAQAVRLLLARLRVNAFALTVVCSFAAALIASLLCLLLDASLPQHALAASVLLMVPGVPLITSVLDLSSNDIVSGVARGALAFLLALSIGIGLVIALWVTGLQVTP